MKNFLSNVSEGLRHVRKVWIVTTIVFLGIIVGVIGYNSAPIQKAMAARKQINETATVNVQALLTPTALPLSGTDAAPTEAPEVSEPTAAPSVAQPVTGGDVDALTKQMQTMMDSLNGMMEQLDQKSANLTPPTAAPAAVDLQPFLVELQAIDQEMGPLMVRIQADLQGNPSPEELASVRAQLEQIQVRMINLMTQLQTTRDNTMPVAGVPTLEPMPGMAGMSGAHATPMPSMDEMMQMMDDMMIMMDDMMGMSSMSDSTGGMSTTDPSMNNMMMDEMMQMMDDMMMMMDDVMQMDMMHMPDM